jgi:hypothetical protein
MLCAFTLFNQSVHGKCCTSGNPFISDAEQPALQSKVMTASLVYRYNDSHQYYYNDSRYNDLPFTQRSFSNYMELQVAYGITEWLTVQNDLGYFINKTQETAYQQTYRGNGLGDLALLIKFNAWHYPKARISINFYYKYGDLWVGAIYFNYQIWKRINLNLQFRNEYRAKASRENDETVNTSGYDVVFFTPQVSVAIPGNWFLSVYADIPVYKYYNDLQMSFGYAIFARVTQKVDFLVLKARNKNRNHG